MSLETWAYSKPNDPKPFPRDSEGNRLECGTEVAYNQSGNVVRGTVEEIKLFEYTTRRNFGWRLTVDIRIRNKATNKLSKVTNYQSILTI